MASKQWQQHKAIKPHFMCGLSGVLAKCNAIFKLSMGEIMLGIRTRTHKSGTTTIMSTAPPLDGRAHDVQATRNGRVLCGKLYCYCIGVYR